MVKKYHITTFGCQANYADSKAIADILEKYGCQQTQSEKNCDILMFNTCSVRQKAEDKMFGLNKNLKALKQKNKKLKIILTGCMLHYPQGILRKRLPEIDFFLPIKNIKRLPNIFKLSKPKTIKHSISENFNNGTTALIPISSGCNNFCSYCIVPYSRGQEISRPVKDIIKDTKIALKNNAKEIWLLGQNVNSYHDTLASPASFLNCLSLPDLLCKSGARPRLQFKKEAGGAATINFSNLLRIINSLPGKFWIRFASPHPKDFSNDLIQTMAECEKFPHYLNLPLQSGDNAILKKMNRPYTVSQYKQTIKKLRRAMPDLAISTDIIVGFPGENQKQFQNTAKIFEEIKFDMAFLSEYSPRPKTLAAQKFKDNIPHKEKENRKNILNEILIKTALEHNQKLVGQTITVLNNRTAGNKLVKITDKNYKPDEFAQVKITKASPWSLTGKLL